MRKLYKFFHFHQKRFQVQITIFTQLGYSHINHIILFGVEICSPLFDMSIYLCYILSGLSRIKESSRKESRNHGTKNAIKVGYLNRHKDTSHTRGIASNLSHIFSSSRLYEKNSTAGMARRRAKGSEREAD